MLSKRYGRLTYTTHLKTCRGLGVKAAFGASNKRVANALAFAIKDVIGAVSQISPLILLRKSPHLESQTNLMICHSEAFRLKNLML